MGKVGHRFDRDMQVGGCRSHFFALLVDSNADQYWRSFRRCRHYRSQDLFLNIELAEAQPTLRTTFLREVRAMYRGPRRATTMVRSPSDVATFVLKVLPENSREHVVALYLDGSNQVIGYTVAATGTANSCIMHPREIFQGVILAGAVALIVAHNHPSGKATPSQQDEGATNRFKEAAKLLGMKFLDHIIVTDDAYHSLSEETGL